MNPMFQPIKSRVKLEEIAKGRTVADFKNIWGNPSLAKIQFKNKKTKEKPITNQEKVRKTKEKQRKIDKRPGKTNEKLRTT